jgi:hypothetical protein
MENDDVVFTATSIYRVFGKYSDPFTFSPFGYVTDLFLRYTVLLSAHIKAAG